MGLHLYCIMPAGARLPAVRGIDGASLLEQQCDDIIAIASEHTAPPIASIAAIQAHNAVVETAMDEHVTPVPVRFGQWMGDTDALSAALRDSLPRWRADLAAFAGCVEFGIRIFDPAGAHVGSEEADALAQEKPASGRAYMAALLRRAHSPANRKQAEAVSALRSCVTGHYRDERVAPLRTEHGVASMAYLVHRRDIDAYQRGVDEVRTVMPGLRFLATGPWPPYSFVS